MRLHGFTAIVAAVALAGCGGGDGEGDGDDRVEGVPAVQQCLEDSDRYEEITPIDADELDTAALSERQRTTIDQATDGSTDALVASGGGPTEEDGVITEAPVSKTRLYFFATEAEAGEAVTEIEPVAGKPRQNVLNGVQAIGRVAVVNYSYGIGDSPGEAPLDTKPIQPCLEAGGFA